MAEIQRTNLNFEEVAGKLADILHVIWSCSISNMGVMPTSDDILKVLNVYEKAKRAKTLQTKGWYIEDGIATRIISPKGDFVYVLHKDEKKNPDRFIRDLAKALGLKRVAK